MSFSLHLADYAHAHEWMAVNYSIPLAALLLYAIHIFFLKSFMANVDKPLKYVPIIKFVWDLLLALGSLFGAMELIPLLLSELREKGVYSEVCSSEAQSTNRVLYFFMWSKFFELLDTTFILLGQKKLIFLHWYHHMATLLYCWDAYVVRNTSGALFTGMNLCVHTVMYGYYALAYFGRLPNTVRAMITGLQLIQMVAGTSITIAYVWCENNNEEQTRNSKWALVMYFSYILLFGKLFIESYVTNKRSGKAPKEKSIVKGD